MTSNENKSRNKSRAVALLLCMPVMLLAGCSQDFASIDDVHVPTSTEERFPIQVVEKPVKMTVSARSGKLPSDDVNRLVGFARAAKEDNSSPVTVTYPSGSTKARGVSQQAVKLLVSQGVPRSMIHAASYNGKSDVVSLSFTRRIAAT
ncbi:MAG: CpaD family pilus assembly lipoprotein, partial [Bosea sp. (in: a-proteobacteria)]